MLKALELHGFKSFADKTRFDFPAGITVVVGPNGSGKSNIVDGIKWVLGEQSAKSLRGKDMSDVIFKGSDVAGRKPMNTAEATLVIDNSDGRLPIDAPEVHITRRVYRSGEGEYLINRQPARMKDIKDMFRGTGVGADAYSMIEQGKVDRLLQASPKDRRAIFEEAAGISRFKAKKIEAQRRLERVDQNMLRLSDIVEEVESRLKSVRNQATKARRYREYSQRLQQLRTQVAQVDWRRLSDQLAGLEADAESHREQAAQSLAQAELLEARLLELDTEMITCADNIRAHEGRLSRVTQEIAQRTAANEHERIRGQELDEEATRLRRDLLVLSDRAGDLKQRLRETQAELASAEAVHRSLEQKATQQENRLSEIVAQQHQLREQGDQRRQKYVARMQAAAVLASQLEAHLSQLATQEQQRSVQQGQLNELETVAQALVKELEISRQAEERLASEATGRHSQLEQVQRKLAELRNLYASRQEDLAQLIGRRRGVAERATVIEELERNFEGLGAGVKDVLARAKQASSGSMAQVRGMVADLVQSPVEYGAAIDVALGDAAQYLVVELPLGELSGLAKSVGALAGRVTFLSSSEVSTSAQTSDGDRAFTDDADVVGRADTLVQADESQRDLVRRLLGQTWVVKSLAAAVRLRAVVPAGTRLVTLEGELLDPLGTLAVGPRQAATNLVSRRSELRAARQELTVLDQQIGGAQRETQHLRTEIEREETAAAETTEAIRKLAAASAEQRLQSHSVDQRLQQNEQQQTAIGRSLKEIELRCVALNASAERCSQQLAESEVEVAAMQQAIHGEEVKLSELDGLRQEAARNATTARVELAKGEQRLEALRARVAQFEEDSRDRERAIAQTRDHLEKNRHRRTMSDLTILTATGEMALLYLDRESQQFQIAAQSELRDSAASGRTEFSTKLQSLRKTLRRLEEQQHQAELAAGQVRHERTALAERMLTDYGIEVATLSAPAAEEEQERAAVEEEIESLRRKINQIGAVNLDALDEIDELETRFEALSGQHRDLSEAKQALERIIHKINADSRRLFIETLEAIRVNFQALYRKAFGGGKADIVLEEGVDVLECGVDIIATPPGKPSFNNSLLSGGEKALTAVALLLAIFQFRPSPFCILDEVDAPFDEANIGRFVDVLKDFLGWTKFVIVTHSKKTMTAATTLYGVTMQESGVSKRVAVRFDDVTDDGHIRKDALERPENTESAQRGVA
jgi:chromosome segregation protein